MGGEHGGKWRGRPAGCSAEERLSSGCFEI